jgi:hypothetical protein
VLLLLGEFVLKIPIPILGNSDLWVTNVVITSKHNDGTYDAIGDGWSAFHSSLIGLADNDGNLLNPAEVYARTKRDKLLQECDYTQTLDYPATNTERSAWAAYRQALRDIPEQEGFPNDVVWPTMPVRDKGGTILQALESLI